MQSYRKSTLPLTLLLCHLAIFFSLISVGSSQPSLIFLWTYLLPEPGIRSQSDPTGTKIHVHLHSEARSKNHLSITAFSSQPPPPNGIRFDSSCCICRSSGGYLTAMWTASEWSGSRTRPHWFCTSTQTGGRRGGHPRGGSTPSRTSP